jgi:hypothetical protein
MISLLISTLVSGNEARIDGLGGYGIMPYVYEELNIFDYPTDILRFDSRILVEKRLTTACTWFGAIHKWNRIGLGISVNRDDYGTSALDEFTYPGGDGKPPWLGYSNPLSPKNKLACVVGLGTLKRNFGLMISCAGARRQEEFTVPSNVTTAVARENRASHSYNVGAGLCVGWLDLCVGYGGVGFEEKQETVGGGTREYANSGGNITTVKLRARIPVNSSLGVIPIVSVRHFELGEFALSDVENEDGSEFNYRVNSDSKFNVVAGIASNLGFCKEKGLLILGITAERYSLHVRHDTEADIRQLDYNVPRANVAVEVSPRTWLTVRGGMDKLFVIRTTDIDYADEHITDGGESVWDEGNNIYFGTQFKFGNLQIDMTINQEYFYEGPYIFTGNRIDLINKLSVNYLF